MIELFLGQFEAAVKVEANISNILMQPAEHEYINVKMSESDGRVSAPSRRREGPF